MLFSKCWAVLLDHLSFRHLFFCIFPNRCLIFCRSCVKTTIFQFKEESRDHSSIPSLFRSGGLPCKRFTVFALLADTMNLSGICRRHLRKWGWFLLLKYWGYLWRYLDLLMIVRGCCSWRNWLVWLLRRKQRQHSWWFCSSCWRTIGWHGWWPCYHLFAYFDRFWCEFSLVYWNNLSHRCWIFKFQTFLFQL